MLLPSSPAGLHLSPCYPRSCPPVLRRCTCRRATLAPALQRCGVAPVALLPSLLPSSAAGLTQKTRFACRVGRSWLSQKSSQPPGHFSKHGHVCCASGKLLWMMLCPEECKRGFVRPQGLIFGHASFASKWEGFRRFAPTESRSKASKSFAFRRLVQR